VVVQLVCATLTRGVAAMAAEATQPGAEGAAGGQRSARGAVQLPLADVRLRDGRAGCDDAQEGAGVGGGALLQGARRCG
jgi:hypothetical protein